MNGLLDRLADAPPFAFAAIIIIGTMAAVAVYLIAITAVLERIAA
jgi:hypothetical protein